MGGTSSADSTERRLAAQVAYTGMSEFKEALYVPTLPPVSTQDAQDVTILFPLLDVSGSMHSKLADVKTGVCTQFLHKIQPNVVAAMAFTDKQYTLANFSSLSSRSDRQEFERAIQSVFIPSHSNTDIPAAVLAYLKMLECFLDPLHDRKTGMLWKANCVIITDGIHAVSDSQWQALGEKSSNARALAQTKRCFLFFHILNLQSRDVDEQVLQRLAQVLQAERAVQAGLQVMQVCDIVSRHMVTLEKCVTELNEVRQDVVNMNANAEFQSKTVPRFNKLKEEVRNHQESIESFQPSLVRLEEETRPVFVEQHQMVIIYQADVVDPTAQLIQNVQMLEETILERYQHITSGLHDARELMTKKAFAGLVSDFSRIQNKLVRIEGFVGKCAHSHELRCEVMDVVSEVRQKFEKVSVFCRENKSHQYMCRTLQGQAQRERERVHRLQEKLNSMAEDFETGAIVPDVACTLCNEDQVGFVLACRYKHVFCCFCLAKHIQASSELNRPAHCPLCPHELFEKEVDSICEMAGKPEVAETYLQRCMQRRVETDSETWYCPKGCGNAICSQIDTSTVVCDECEHRFCPKCTEPPHPEFKSCSVYLETRLRQTKDAEHRRLDALMKNIEYLEREPTDFCPKCNFSCQKIDGCSHVTCAKCDTNFNFGRQRISKDIFNAAKSEAQVVLTMMETMSTMSEVTLASSSSGWLSRASSFSSASQDPQLALD